MSGITSYEKNVIPFIGAHPQLFSSATIVSATAERTILAGTVLATVTSSGKLTELSPSATDGSQTATHILTEDCTVPSSGDYEATCYTHCEALDGGLTWPSSITAAQKTAAIASLRSVGIFITLNAPA